MKVIWSVSALAAMAGAAAFHVGGNGGVARPGPVADSARAERPPAPPGRSFVLQLSTNVYMQATEVFRATVNGEWVVQPLAGTGRRGRAFSARIERPQVDLGAARSERAIAGRGVVEAGLGRPCFFVIDSAGAVTEVRFDNEIDTMAQSLLRAIITGSQVVGAAGARDRWSANEVDTGGRYEASYQRAAAGGSVRYQKQKVRYTLPAQATNGAAPLPRVEASLTTLVLDDRGGLQELAGEEHVVTQVEAGLPALRARTRLALAATASPPAATANAPALLALFQRWQGVAADDTRFVSSLSPSKDFDLARINGQTFETVVRRAHAAKTELGRTTLEQDRAYMALVSLLRQDPEARAAAARRFAERGGTEGVMLLDALRDAGSPEAQRVVLELLQHAPVGADLEIVQRLSRLARPSPEVVSSLIAATRNPRLRTQAYFGLGAAAYALRTLDGATATRALAAVADGLRAAREPDAVADALTAIGTAGGQAALDGATAHLADRSAMARGAAVEALRRVEDHRAGELLVRVVESDPDADVRRRTVHTLRQRRPSPEAARAVERCVRRDPSMAVRTESLALLSDWRPTFPAGRATLVWAAQHDADPGVRKNAAALLTGWPEETR